MFDPTKYFWQDSKSMYFATFEIQFNIDLKVNIKCI